MVHHAENRAMPTFQMKNAPLSHGGSRVRGGSGLQHVQSRNGEMANAYAKMVVAGSQVEAAAHSTHGVLSNLDMIALFGVSVAVRAVANSE